MMARKIPGYLASTAASSARRTSTSSRRTASTRSNAADNSDAGDMDNSSSNTRKVKGGDGGVKRRGVLARDRMVSSVRGVMSRNTFNNGRSSTGGKKPSGRNKQKKPSTPAIEDSHGAASDPTTPRPTTGHPQSPPGSPADDTTADLSMMDLSFGVGCCSSSSSSSSPKKDPACTPGATISSTARPVSPSLVRPRQILRDEDDQELNTCSRARTSQSVTSRHRHRHGHRRRHQQLQQAARIERAAAALDAAGHKHLEAGRFGDALEAYRRALKLKRRILSQSGSAATEPGDDQICRVGPAVHREEAMLGTASTVGVEDEDEEEEFQPRREALLASVATSVNNLCYARQMLGLASPDEAMDAYRSSLAIKRRVRVGGGGGGGGVEVLRHVPVPVQRLSQQSSSIMICPWQGPSTT